MATTTPNFGWAVPTSTDLVKDGAVAIETLGDAIDASLVDLKGGTTGQVLSKASGTDMDFTWTTSSSGMTNPMTTTGDTIYSSSGSTPARLGIGSTGQVLTVSGGLPSWATPAGGGGMTQLATGSITTTLNLTSISQDYKELVLYISDFTSGSANSCTFRINNDSGSNYYGILMQQIGANAGQFNARNGATSIDLIANDRAASTGDNHIVLRIPNYTVSAYKLVEFSSFVTLDGGTTWGTQTGTIGYKSATAVSQLNIFGQTAGTYTLYGVN